MLKATSASKPAFLLKPISYKQLAVAAVGGVLLVVKASGENDVLHGWGRLWLITAGGLIGLAGWQALRKCKLERA